MAYWYEDKKNLIELAEFLVDSDEITSAKELLDYFKFPERYTEVWKTYQEEVEGKSQSKCIFKRVPSIVALVQPSSQCES